MKIFNSLEEIFINENTVVALGNFDGIHRGHQEIIGRTVSSAKDAGLKSAVFTFSNHTRTLLKDTPQVKNILYPEEKAEIIESMGIDYLFTIPFTRDILIMEPERFVKEILVDKLKLREAYCGFNYRFGHKASGTPEVLMREGLKHGFGIHVQEPFMIDSIVVSSTHIRKLIEAGDMEGCCKFMGRSYEIGGEVVVGNKLGRTIGFPTSNVMIDDTMASPPNGVYITYCTYNGVKYPSVTNVGVKPTIGRYKKNVETHIFNFDKELYGKNIRVEFIKRTRLEKKFDSIQALSDQIKSDCIMAKAYHREKGIL
ncbi:MAG: bifunctional riboflavin kinase/FAD synthetase [Clostridiales bacterium]|nr:bifunctional riboflavin kinase/FAD synthetase [Clostridiales bacterium]